MLTDKKVLKYRPTYKLSARENVQKAIDLFVECYCVSPSICYAPASVYRYLQDEDKLNGTTPIRLGEGRHIVVKE